MMCKTNRSLNEETALSPVIGTILMIGMVGILAALIATYAFDDVTMVKEVPQASLKATNQSTGGFTLKHQGGDEINLDDAMLMVEDVDVSGSLNGTLVSGGTVYISTSLAIGDSIKFIDVPTQQVFAEFTARM